MVALYVISNITDIDDKIIQRSIKENKTCEEVSQKYLDIYNTEMKRLNVDAPDLLIYLRSSIPNLVSQIHKRGRDYENSISIDYLSRLNERYEAWIHNYKKGQLLIIDIDNLDFVENKNDLDKIINLIDEKIN